MTAEFANASDPLAIALHWLSSAFKGVRLVESAIVVPRFGGVEVRVRVPGPCAVDTLDMSATVLVADSDHPLFAAIVAKGNELFGAEFIVEPIASGSKLKLRRTLPYRIVTESVVTQNVAEIGVAGANLHNALTPIFAKTRGP